MARGVERLLIVDDDEGVRSQLRWCFPEYQVLLAGDCSEALERMRGAQPPIVLLDLGLPPDPANTSQGLMALREILQGWPATKVVVVTGNDERESALKAVAAGAYDFYQKPVDADVLRLIVSRALRLHAIEEENRRLVRAPESPLPGIMAAAPAMLEVCRMVERVAPVDATVLVLGESGTGKELVARALHALSDRAEQRFVAINCASIPETLLESELFGYERGAFTGAVQRTVGRIEYANGGTLFLDEVGDLPLALQAKLLRFLQERVVERLGGRGEVPVDVRVVAATNRDLQTMRREGAFREDLFYRLSEFTLRIPALREREGDAALLAHGLLRHFVQRDQRGIAGFSPEALSAIEAYDWPGNVRELENVIRRSVIVADGRVIQVRDLGLPHPDSGDGEPPLRLREAREAAERNSVARALGLANGNIMRAAEMLGVSRPTVYALLNKFGMKADSSSVGGGIRTCKE
ncbi:PEP-CTERM-box response regulator transcription factor [Arhodomonas sp. SL1]|uniref:PEP-CTERM-box response regulator transcription factor n=1 Tax=Arhodomonas sp. SL1 TaxID=3425691 RepID=UPI003F8825E5